MSEFKYISSKAIDYMVWDIVDQIEGVNRTFDIVVGVVRGGLVPAVMLSHRLDAKLVALHVSFRDDGREREDILRQVDAELQTIADLVMDGARVLVVDDIVDGGETMKTVYDELRTRIGSAAGFIEYAALIVNRDQPFLPHYRVQDIHRSTDQAWRVFPWETKRPTEAFSSVKELLEEVSE